MAEDPIKHPRGKNPDNTGQYSNREYREDSGVELIDSQDPFDELRATYIEDAQHSDGYYDATDPETASARWDAMVGAHDARVRAQAAQRILAMVDDAPKRDDEEMTGFTLRLVKAEWLRDAAATISEPGSLQAPTVATLTAQAKSLSAEDRADLVKRLIADDAETYARSDAFARFYPAPAAYPEGLPAPEIEFVWDDGDSPDMVLEYGDDEEDCLVVTKGGDGELEVLYGTGYNYWPGGPTQLSDDQRAKLETFAETAYGRGMGVMDGLEGRAFQGAQVSMERIAAEQKENSRG
jgi:hypothetical protein